MKTIGLLGGMGWPSTLTYYRLINEGVAARLGGMHAARIALWSVDFADVEACQREGRWDDASAILADGARRLEAAGAEILVLCTNTMHRLAGPLQAATRVPLLHIADATAEEARARGLTKLGLLGTRFTMEQDFYRGRLEAHGFEVLVPDADGRAFVNRVIYEELVHGVVRPSSRAGYLAAIADLVARGADGVVLGCTEIGLLVSAADLPDVAVLDTTEVHARAAVVAALGSAPDQLHST